MNLQCRALAALLAFVMAVSPVMAADVLDGSTPANGKPSSGDVGATWNGASHKVLRSDADGILRVTEEYPPQLQNDVFNGATSVAVTLGLKQIGLAWSVSPFGDRSVRLTRVATGGNAVSPVLVYLFGSDDNVTFYPLVSSAAWTGTGQALTDTTKVDTLRTVLPSGPAGGASASTMNWKITLPADLYPGRYLAVYAARIDSASGSAYALSTSFEGRWK